MGVSERQGKWADRNRRQERRCHTVSRRKSPLASEETWSARASLGSRSARACARCSRDGVVGARHQMIAMARIERDGYSRMNRSMGASNGRLAYTKTRASHAA